MISTLWACGCVGQKMTRKNLQAGTNMFGSLVALSDHPVWFEVWVMIVDETHVTCVRKCWFCAKSMIYLIVCSQ